MNIISVNLTVNSGTVITQYVGNPSVCILRYCKLSTMVSFAATNTQFNIKMKIYYLAT